MFSLKFGKSFGGASGKNVAQVRERLSKFDHELFGLTGAATLKRNLVNPAPQKMAQKAVTMRSPAEDEHCR